MYKLSRKVLMLQDVWTGDVGDDVLCIDRYYGVDEGNDTGIKIPVNPSNTNISLNKDEDIEEVCQLLGNFDFEADDGNWGINVYCQAVVVVLSCLNNKT